VNIEDELAELSISLLQLQRSALIDTQTVMQVMIDKGLCDLSDLVETRSRIEKESDDIKRIDQEIVNRGGTVCMTPVPENVGNNAQLQKQLDQLQKLLTEMTSSTQP
jgi:hypothetical protein